MKTLGDIIQYKKPGEVDSYLENLLCLLGEIKTFMEAQKRTDITVMHGNLCDYLIRQLDIYKKTWLTSSEVSAFVCRNFFEASLILQFTSISKDNFLSYVVAHSTDEQEIYEKLSSIDTAKDTLDKKKLLLNRVDELEEILKKNNLLEYKKKAKIFSNFSDLSKNVNRLDEYKEFYKLYSKYAHPTSWVVNGNADNAHAFPIKNIFLIQLQKYLGEIVEMLQKQYEQDFVGDRFN